MFSSTEALLTLYHVYITFDRVVDTYCNTGQHSTRAYFTRMFNSCEGALIRTKINMCHSIEFKM